MSHSPAQPPLAAGTSCQKFLWIPISYNIKSKLLSICIALQFWPFPQLWADLCPELVSATPACLKVIPLPSSMPAGCPPCQQADSSLHGCTQCQASDVSVCTFTWIPPTLCVRFTSVMEASLLSVLYHTVSGPLLCHNFQIKLQLGLYVCSFFWIVRTFIFMCLQWGRHTINLE